MTNNIIHDNESEFHVLEKNKMTSDIFIFGFDIFGLFFSFKDVLVFLRIRKKAKIKKSNFQGVIQILCPYCHNTSMQEEKIASYICPYCKKKSYIDTSGGLSVIFKKKSNKL